MSTDGTSKPAQYDLMISTTRAATGTLDVRSPYDDTLLAKVQTCGPEHVNDALTVAHRLFRSRDMWVPVPQRIAVLERLGALMKQNADELALLATHEGGKPLLDSQVEVKRAIDGVRLCIEALRTHAGNVIPLGTTPATVGRIAYTQKEPIGVVVAVSAFNHPLNLIVHQVAPAVAAGCPVIVKPAADTPLSCLRFVSLLREAGLDNDRCQVLVTADVATAQQLVTDSRIGFFSFIGSARVGWMLRSKLAPGVRCALEHGGVAPVILDTACDYDLARQALLKGGFYHAGQVCVSVQRVFVERSEAQRFARQLATAATALRVGDPADASTEVGPLIRTAEVERVTQWVDEAVAGGARALCGGQALSASCYAPTVLLEPPADARVSTQEIFGPVVCVFAYDDVNEAIERANALPTAFQAAVFSHNIDHAIAIARRLDASAVMVNDHTAFRDDVMPFAGLRESGLGTGGIPYTLEDMQIEKMTVIKSAGIA